MTAAVIPVDRDVLAERAAHYVRSGGLLPTQRAGRFDRERLPEPLEYYTGTAGLTFRERRGRWRTTRCEFHNGSDSLRVNVETGAWCCMACGVNGGDVLAYHMRWRGLGFVEAACELGAWTADPHGPLVPLERRPAGLSAADCLALLEADATLVAIEAARAARLGRVEEAVRDAILRAAGRITTVISGRRSAGGAGHA